MKKPEKKKVYKPTDIQVGEGAYYDLREIKGYNQAIDDRETWLKEAMSVDKIQKIMYKTEDDYELGETNSLHIAIAKAISKSILGE